MTSNGVLFKYLKVFCRIHWPHNSRFKGLITLFSWHTKLNENNVQYLCPNWSTGIAKIDKQPTDHRTVLPLVLQYDTCIIIGNLSKKWLFSLFKPFFLPPIPLHVLEGHLFRYFILTYSKAWILIWLTQLWRTYPTLQLWGSLMWKYFFLNVK